MAGPNDFTGQNIQDTYQRVLQISGSGQVTDGTGSIVLLNANAVSSASFAISASYAVSASHEITFELSSSHAETSDQTGTVTNADEGTHFVTFVDSDNSVLTSETHFTTPFFTLNPRRRTVLIDGRLKVLGSEITIESGSISASKGIFAPSITSSAISMSGPATEISAVSGTFNHVVTDGGTIEFRNATTGDKEGNLIFDTSQGLQVKNADKTDDAPLKVKDLTVGVGLIVGTSIESQGHITSSTYAVNSGSEQVEVISFADSTNSAIIGVKGGLNRIQGSTTFVQPITASSNISASGDIIANNATFDGKITAPELTPESQTTATLKIGNQDNSHPLTNHTIQIGYAPSAGPDPSKAAPLIINSNITASGDISASGTIITDKLKANLATGVDNSVLIKDADGFIKTDEIDSRVWGSTLLDNNDTAACSTRIAARHCTDANEHPLVFINSGSDGECQIPEYSEFLRFDCRNRIFYVDGKIKVKGSDVTIESGSISASKGIFTPSITASNVSMSGTVISTTGSFNHIITDGDTIEFRNPSNGNKIGHLKFDPAEGMQIGGPQSAFGLVDSVDTFNAPLRANRIIAKNKVESPKIENDSSITIDSAQDIILSADGDQIYMSDGSTNRFTFNVDSTPELDVNGAFRLDCSGDITFDADYGNINNLGIINQQSAKTAATNYVFGGGQGYNDVLIYPGSIFEPSDPRFALKSPGQTTLSQAGSLMHSFVMPPGYKMTGINVVASATSVTWKVQLSTPFCTVKTIVTGSATTCPVRPTLANFKLGATSFGNKFIAGAGTGNGEVFHILAALSQNDVLYGAMPIIEPV